MSGEIRTQAIILQRRPITDDSLLLEVLCEDGKIESFRLPGILKSRKRSAFHLAPGCVCRIRYHAQAARALVPREIETIFSPFADNQEYFRLSTVAELLKLSSLLEPGKDAAVFFRLLYAFLETIPDEVGSAEQHADRFYWEFLKLMGLAHETQTEFTAYDLAEGFLTPRDASVQADSGLRLPAWWIKRLPKPENEPCTAADYRDKIRRFLSGR